MWKINLDTIEKCENLVDLCKRHKDRVKIDVTYGRYIVDGCSILGVLSVMLHEVDIVIRKNDEIITDDFDMELAYIGAWKEK